jgi:hypothetical protein
MPGIFCRQRDTKYSDEQTGRNEKHCEKSMDGGVWWMVDGGWWMVDFHVFEEQRENKKVFETISNEVSNYTLNIL